MFGTKTTKMNIYQLRAAIFDHFGRTIRPFISSTSVEQLRSASPIK